MCREEQSMRCMYQISFQVPLIPRSLRPGEPMMKWLAGYCLRDPY